MRVDPSYEGRPVFVKGRIQVNEPLTEPEYGVAIAAVKLKRRVQMYQWVEEKEEVSSWWGVGADDKSPVTYSTTWRDKLVDSSLFTQPVGHANPKSFPMDSGVSVSEVVRVSAHVLSRELKDHFSSFTALTSDQRPDRRDIKMHSGLYYHSFDVWSPEVGDTRVQLSYSGPSDQVVSILGRQVGQTLQPFYTDTKDLTTVLEGDHQLSDVLAAKFPQSGVWLIRVPAYFAVYCAYSSLTFIFYSAGRRSRLVHAFVHHNKGVLCHVVTGATVLLVMALTWFSYSPVLGCLHLLGFLLLLTYCLHKGYSLHHYFDR